MKKCLLVALAAGTVVAPAAFGQEMQTLPFGGEIRVQPDNYPAPAGYESRAVQVVYDNVTNVFGNGTGGNYLGANNQTMEDISFVGSPWNGTPGRLITEVTWGVAVVGVPTSTAERMFMVWWDEDDFLFTGFAGVGTNMIRAGAVPLAIVTVDPGTAGAGFIWQFTVGLTGLPGGGVAIPDDDNGCIFQTGFVKTAMVAGITDWSNLPPGTLQETCGAAGNQRGPAFGSNSLAVHPGNPATVGTSSINYGRDMLVAAMCPNEGAFIGSANPPVNAGNFENRFFALAHAASGTTVTMGNQVRFRGDVPPPPPPANTDLGCIPDAGLSSAGHAVAAGEVDWFHVCLPGDALDSLLQYMNVLCTSTGDVKIALYASDGAVAGVVGGVSTAVADGTGPGTDDILTFGVRSIAHAGGDAIDYDGRNGELAAGDYYLAVAPSGSTFAPGYTVNASANAGGNYDLTFTTNVGGTAAPAATPPQVTGLDYGSVDPTSPGFAPGVGAPSGTRAVTWHKVTLASPADASHFLDMDFFALSTGSADGVCYVFNSSGDVVYFSDDNVTGTLLPQVSTGEAGARTYGTNPTAFDGNTPAGASAGLPAGDYYICTGLFATQDLTGVVATGQRWHVRGTSGSNLNLGIDMYYGGSGGGGGGCDSDYDQNGVGDQDDVSLLINIIATGDGSQSPLDPDFNCNGVADQDDVSALIDFIASGGTSGCFC